MVRFCRRRGFGGLEVWRVGGLIVVKMIKCTAKG